MSSTAQKNTIIDRQTLQEAIALQTIERSTELPPGEFFDVVREQSSRLNGENGEALIRLGNLLMEKMQLLDQLCQQYSGREVELFGTGLTTRIPPVVGVKIDPYSLTFLLPPRYFRQVFEELGLPSRYGDSEGVHLDGNVNDPRLESLVNLVKVRRVHVDGSSSDAVYQVVSGRGGGYFATKIDVPRHEELHAFHGIMKNAGIYVERQHMELGLIEEESVTAISMGELHHDFPQPHEVTHLTNTSLYFDKNVRYGAFRKLAERTYGKNSPLARAVIDAIKRGQEVLERAYQEMDPVVLGWTLPLLRFSDIPNRVPEIVRTYQTM